MRTYYDIHLGDRNIQTRELHGEEIVRAGRYLIAKTLLELGAATVDPLSPENPLIFSAGPFAGSSFSNANRTSVGCKSPLTGGVKEANRGGVGAVMGSKKVKAVVVDLDKIPPFQEAKKVNAAIKDYAKMLQADSMVANFYAKIGTMGMADLQNTLGGLPVRNFSAGQLV